MNGFYELLSNKHHLNEYHEYYFLKKNIHGLSENEIRKLQEYEHFDIRLLPFKGSDQIKKAVENEKFQIIYPDRLYFTGDFHNSKLEQTDYPIVGVYQLLVISKKLLSIIDSVKQFSRDIVQAVIFDFLEMDPFNENSELKDQIKQTFDYVFVKLNNFVLIDNEDTSKFNKRTKYKWDFNIVMPEDGLDPIFRIKQIPERIFITEAVYKAIEEYNIKNDNKVKGINLYNGTEYFTLSNNKFINIC